jgi:uncharacterized protein (DUF885 family)
MSLEKLSDQFWKMACEYSPTIATVRAMHQFDDRLRSFDDDYLSDLARRFRKLGLEAEATPPESTSDLITLGLLVHESDVWATEIEQRFLVAAIDPYLGPHTRILSDTQQNTVQNQEQANALLDRYRAIPKYLESAYRLQLENARAGMTPASASLRRVLSQLDG